MIPDRISRYPVLRPLGRGGMGEIYLARDPDLDRNVALKVLHADGDAGQLRSEARAAAALRHPNIVTVYEIGSDGERAFIAMEYVDGASLRDLMARGLEMVRLIEIGAGVARALAAAHRAGVLHRDIKPDNVMIDAQGAVKVVDFGIAHRTGRLPTADPSPAQAAASFGDDLAATIPVADASDALTTGTIFGTPAYISPEQILGQPATPRSDIYSLGVVLYEAFSGHLPFWEENLVATLTKVADPNAHPAPLAAARPDLPDELVELIESMLSADPESRPDATEAAARLEAIAAAVTVPIELRLRRPSRRPLWPLLIAALVGAAALGVVAVVQGGGTPQPAAGALERAPALAQRIAIARLDGRFPDLGHSAPSGSIIATALVKLLDGVSDLEAVLVDGPDRAAQLAAARRSGADVLLTGGEGALDPATGARLELLEVASGEPRRSLELGPAELGELVEGIAREVTAELAPQAGAHWDESAGAVSFALGHAAFSRREWAPAAVYFEQVTKAQPELPTGWFYLAWARGWTGAPGELTREAARRAEETATTELERRLGRALALYTERRYRDAAELLAPMVESNPRDRDLLYTYGEALFHDGQIGEALELFDRCLELSPRFEPAALHPQQVAEARLDPGGVRRYAMVLQNSHEAVVAYLSGDDEGARELGFSPEALAVVTGDFETADRGFSTRPGAAGLAYRLARAAHRGRRDEGRRDFARHWRAVAEAAEKPKGAFDLQKLARVLIVAGYPAELRIVKRWWERHDTPTTLNTPEELAVLAAPLLGGSLPERESLTTRMGRVADAIAAGREGQADRAADLLAKLADDPEGSATDLLIWHAYARALAAQGGRTELERRCRAWRRPGRLGGGVGPEVVIALWSYCDEALAE